MGGHGLGAGIINLTILECKSSTAKPYFLPSTDNKSNHIGM